MKKEKTLLFLTIATYLLLITGATYAYLVAVLGDSASTNVNVTANTTDSLMFNVEKELGLHLTSKNFGEGLGNLSDSTTAKAVLMANNKTNKANSNYYIYLEILQNEFYYTTNNKQGEILLQIIDPNNNELKNIPGLNYITSEGISGFDITYKEGIIEIASNYLITVDEQNKTHKTEQNWTIKLVFVNLKTNQAKNAGKNFEAQVLFRKEKIETIPEVCAGKNMASCIKENYKLDKSIIHHNGSVIINDKVMDAEDGSYRYTGRDENVHNFVCFGSDEEDCPNDNLYRIIGVFDDKVKLIKYDYATKEVLGVDGNYARESDIKPTYKGSLDQVSRYYWDYTNENGNWTVSKLNEINLNRNYLNNLGTNWTEKIVETTWNIGGIPYIKGIEGNAKIAYDYEIGTNKKNKTYDAKIGIMYISEYYYSASLKNWTLVGYDRNNDEDKDYRSATMQSWMYMGSSEWTISQRSDLLSDSFCILYTGSGSGSNITNPLRSVRPTFYLKSDIVLISGDGTSKNPYRIT